MARKATDEQVYIEAMHKHLEDGGQLDDITATKIQKQVGGQYSRISRIVAEFKAKHEEERKTDSRTPQATWFKEMTTRLNATIEQQIGGIWETIQSNINESISLATENYDAHKDKMDLQRQEDNKQIERLESENEKLTGILEQCQHELEQAKEQITQLKIENSNLMGITNNQKNDLQEQKEELILLRADKLTLVSKLSNIEGQLQVYREKS